GMALYMLKKKRCSYFGQILLGFGLLFLGMNLMSQGVSPLKESQYFIDMMADFGDIPILGVLMGAAFTALIQSSSAATALVISMGMEGAVSLNTAIALIMGANIGTCITAFLASIGSSLAAKRAALSHILFNVIGVAIFFPFISQFALLAATTASELPRQIANAHSLFNVITVLILLPFSGIMVAAIKMLLRGDEIKVDSGTEFIDERTLDTPSVATDLARRESIRMAKMALKMIRSDQKLLKQYDSKIMVSIGKTEDSIDEIDNLIESYLNKIAEKGLSSRQSNAVSVLLHNISDIERVGDHANNISELIEKAKSDGITFSKQAMRELNDMFSMVMKSYAGAIRVMETSDRKTAERVLELEMQIDQMEKDMESAHLKRLKKGACKPHAGPIYLDIVRNMERISDHAHNIAYAVLMGF
ncbi:MAG: Na/Pi cotransporter family protein, partial [Candidatus Aenigmatarchaeota archaeon]